MPPLPKTRVVCVTNQGSDSALILTRLSIPSTMAATIYPTWFGEQPSGDDLEKLVSQINRAFGSTPEYERTVVILCHGKACHSGFVQLYSGLKAKCKKAKVLLFLQINQHIVFKDGTLNDLVLTLIQGGVNTITDLEMRFGDLGLHISARPITVRLFQQRQIAGENHHLVTVDPAARK